MGLEVEEQINYTYILTCSDGTLYCGWTNHLEKRVKDHNEGRGAKYTRARRPVVLSYYEVFATKEEAMRREYAIKRLTRRQKLALIASRESGDEAVHHDVVADAPAHDEQVEDFVGAEVLVPGVEKRQL